MSHGVQIQKEVVVSDLKRENQFLFKRYMEMYMIDLERERYVLKWILRRLGKRTLVGEFLYMYCTSHKQ